MDTYGKWIGVIGICLSLTGGLYGITVAPLETQVEKLEEKVQEVQIEQGKVLVELKYINLNLVALKTILRDSQTVKEK